MANFIITCPHCRRQLSAYESWVGTEVECPFCHNIVLVQREVTPKIWTVKITWNGFGIVPDSFLLMLKILSHC